MAAGSLSSIRHEPQRPRRTRPAAVRRAHAMWTVERAAPLGGTRCGPRPSGEHRVLCCSQARHADTSGGRVRACLGLSELECQPGTRKGPGWFVNRSPTLTPQRSAVQAWTVPGPCERDASDPGQGTSAKRCPMRPVLRTGPVWFTGWVRLRGTRRARRCWWRSAPGPARAYPSHLAHC